MPSRSAISPGGGARTILGAQLVKLAVRLTSAALLARLLSPDAYGLHGMAAMIYSLLYMVRDVGVFTAIQQPGLTTSRFHQLCALGAGAGLALAVVCALLGQPLAWFFDEPRLPPIMAALAVAFLFSGTTLAPIALLYREQRIAAAAGLDVTATVISTITALVAAASGAGVWSLVLLSIAYEVTMAIGSWWLSPWRPGWRIAGGGWSGILALSVNLTGHTVAHYLARTVDQVVVGRMGRASDLGLYGRGVQATTALLQVAVAPLSGWGVTSLARLRDDRAAFTALAARFLNGLFHFSLAPAALCVVAPETVVRIFFGPRWLEAAGVVQWLGIATAVQPWLFVQSWMLQAGGHTRRLLTTSLLGLALITTACLLARGHGLETIAQATAIGTLLHALVALPLGTKPLGLRAGDLLRPLLAPVIIHGGLALALVALRRLAPDAAWWWPLPLAAGYYGAAWIVFPAVRRETRDHFLWRP